MKFVKTSLFLGFMMLAIAVSAQNRYTLKGNEAFEKRYWFAAIDNYKVALKKEKDKELKKLITYRIAQSYERTRDIKNAVSWYQKVIKKGGKFLDDNPKVMLKLADALKKMERYEEAMEQYMSYQEVYPNDEKAIRGTKSCELAMKWQQKPTRYLVENVKQLNTKRNDAVPIYASKKKNELIFQSYRDGSVGKGTTDVSGEAFPDLYITKIDRKTGQWSQPVTLAGAVNSEFAEGAPSMNKKCSALYFTRCENHEKEIKGCDIYKSFKKGQGFGEPQKIVIFEDTAVKVTTHPHVLPDESKIYFVSDMKGGQGGYDIWVADWDKKKKKYVNPKNLGPEINTPGHEYYPYIHEDGTLYFSSNGHLGMGGFDLFKANKEGSGFGPVTNLKYPLNSALDDVSIVFNGEVERGFISSNRAGGKGLADIWSFVLPKAEVWVEGIVADCNGGPIANAKVTLKGSNSSKKDTLTGPDGKYKFKLELGVMYSLKAKSDEETVNQFGTKKLKYFASEMKTVDVIGIDDSKTFVQDLCLEKIPSGGIELPNIVYKYNSAELTNQAKIELKKLIDIMVENPTLVIELGSHTDFRGGDAYNEKLAKGRALSAVKYIASQGIDRERMEYKGYGEKVPKTIDSTVFSKLSPAHKEMFPEGTVLDEAYITKQNKNKQEIAHQMNRRTEFKVLRTDYVPKGAEGAEAKGEEGE